MIHEFNLKFSPASDLKFILGFASKVENRPILRTVHFSIIKGHVILQATNSYQAIRVEIFDFKNEEINYVGAAFRVEFLEFMVKMLKKANASLFIDTDHNTLCFQITHTTVKYLTTAVEGSFPNIDGFFFDANNEELELEKKWFHYFSTVYHSTTDYIKFQVMEKTRVEMFFDTQMFLPILKKFRNQELVKVVHQKSTIKPFQIIVEDGGWKYQILMLPIRMD